MQLLPFKFNFFIQLNFFSKTDAFKENIHCTDMTASDYSDPYYSEGKRSKKKKKNLTITIAFKTNMLSMLFLD